MQSLPSNVHPAIARPKLMDYGTWNKPVLGGSMTRTDRPGNRFFIQVDLAPIKSDDDGAALTQVLRSAKREGLEIRFPLGEFDATPVGAPVVNGSTSKGTNLNLRGMTPNAVLKKGRFFSVTHLGRSYLHSVESEVTVNLAGEATIVVDPELRVILSDGDPCEFEQPVFQGVIDMPDWEWTLRLDKYMDISFPLVERW